MSILFLTIFQNLFQHNGLFCILVLLMYHFPDRNYEIYRINIYIFFCYWYSMTMILPYSRKFYILYNRRNYDLLYIFQYNRNIYLISYDFKDKLLTGETFNRSINLITPKQSPRKSKLISNI